MILFSTYWTCEKSSIQRFETWSTGIGFILADFRVRKEGAPVQKGKMQGRTSLRIKTRNWLPLYYNGPFSV